MEAMGVLTPSDLAQISEFGHNPIQLFDKEHEQSQLNCELECKYSQGNESLNLSNKTESERGKVIRIITPREGNQSIVAINTYNEIYRKQYLIHYRKE